MIEVGMTYTAEKTVTPDMTAKAIGSGGLEVFGTPFMMGLMEYAAMQCVQPELPETGISANGKMITFKVTAHDADGLIGEGIHTRAVIDNARFLQKCNDKLARV